MSRSQDYHARSAWQEVIVETEWLEVFVEAARRGSLTATGQALGYTQSAVSRQIAALERSTGAPLFERLPRGVRLTEEGRCLLAHAEAVLGSVRAARRDLDALRDLDAGRLRVGAFDSAVATLVPVAMAAFRAAYPRVALSLVAEPSAALLGRLQAGEVDVAVVSVYPHQTLWAGGAVELRHLTDDPLLVALPAGHPLAAAGRDVLRLADLAGERWVEGFPDALETLAEACRRAGFTPRVDFEVREWTAKQGFVAAGLGLALVPRLAAAAVRPGVVLRPLHPDDAPVRTVHAATRRGPAVPPAVPAFLTHLDQAVLTLRTPTANPSATTSIL
jgi:DNA-binding transcriptional LysR family regulator